MSIAIIATITDIKADWFLERQVNFMRYFMNTQREDGDYCPENVIVTEIFQPVEYKNGSRSGQLQAFTIRIEQSYTNK